MKYNFTPSNLYAMDETPVWKDIVEATTVSKVGGQDVVLKSTRHVPACVSFSLCANAY